jgi:hypothetical protein
MPDGGAQQQALTKRWTELVHHSEQLRWWTTETRFNTVPAGRRSGKTELLKRKIVKRALRGTKYDDARFFVGAPTREQAKRIYWNDLKRLVPRWALASKPSETELVISLRNGSEIHVVGLDKPERIEGSPWDGGGLDEIGNCKPQAWQLNIRPALSDRHGWCDLIGVPEGRNHYYDLDRAARADDTGEWGAFHWKSADILPPEEIEAAKRDLDELSFQQEYEASFVSFEGRAYYKFDEKTHCAPLQYDPKAPLLLMFDFNIAPGVCAMAQEQRLPNQYYRDSKGVIDLSRPVTGTGIIGEVFIPQNSNTPAVCRAILKNKAGEPSVWSQHKGVVICFGDATGGNDGTKAVRGSDWDLIRAELTPTFGQRLLFDVGRGNPPERSRINAVNSRLQTTDGTIKMMVDPVRAPHVVKDFEGVVLLKGGSGEIDKKATPELTHLTDGIGYYVERKYPTSGAGMRRLEVTGV